MSNAIERADAAFHFDVVKITFSLFTLLQGMEKVREMYRHLYAARQGLDARKREELAWSEGLLVAPSYLDLQPHLSGVYNLDLIGQGNEVEQLAYRGWVEEVYALWESPHRADLKLACEVEGELANALNPELKFIRPRVTPMGDLRHIRNDLVHKGGVASADETGKCQVLKWFEPGEKILLNTDHVLDFLHHMGMLNFSGGRTVTDDAGAIIHGVGWSFSEFDTLLKKFPTVRMISLRTAVEPARNSDELLCLLSIVYSNGFCVNHCRSTGLSDTEANRTSLQHLLAETHITAEGDLDSPAEWLCIKAFEAYLSDVVGNEKRRKGEEVQDFPVPDGGFPGPWKQFRESF